MKYIIISLVMIWANLALAEGYLDIISSEASSKISADQDFCRKENIDIRECVCSTHQLVPVVKSKNAVYRDLNQLIQNKVRSILSDSDDIPFMQELTFETTVNNKDLLGIAFQYYIYYAGTPHPTHLKDYIIYDLRNNKELKFSDIVDRKQYKNITNYVKEYVKKIGIKCDVEDPINERTRFFFFDKRKGIYVHIDTADWAYACGGVDVPLPKEYITNPLIKSMYE